MTSKLQRKSIRESTVHIHVRNDHYLMPIIPAEGFENVPRTVYFNVLDGDHARKIHKNTLLTIRDRGGMTVQELYWNLTKKFPLDEEPKNLTESLILFALDLRKAAVELL